MIPEVLRWVIRTNPSLRPQLDRSNLCYLDYIRCFMSHETIDSFWYGSNIYIYTSGSTLILTRILLGTYTFHSLLSELHLFDQTDTKKPRELSFIKILILSIGNRALSKTYHNDRTGKLIVSLSQCKWLVSWLSFDVSIAKWKETSLR